MDVYFTLDYELFLGARTGTPERCLTATLDRLTATAQRYGVRFTIFVDTAYLRRAKELGEEHAELAADYEKVRSHLTRLSREGHDLQLHIHPQWAYSAYRDGRWVLDAEHYKLTDIDSATAHRLFAEGVEELREISGRAPTAFRAGGFSAQPTALLTELLTAHGIDKDSSVYAGNVYRSAMQDYDYSTAPCGRAYRFDADICVPSAGGKITELPINSCRVSPLFYWRLALQRLTKSRRHRRLGDGISVKTTGASIRERLLRPSTGFATIDESKISYLTGAFREALRRGDSTFCVIGHPKLATEYSLTKFGDVLATMQKAGATFKTISML